MSMTTYRWKYSPLLGTKKLGDIPTPDLVWSGRYQLGFDRRGVRGLASTLADLVLGSKQAIHPARRTILSRSAVALSRDSGLHPADWRTRSLAPGPQSVPGGGRRVPQHVQPG